MPMFILYAKDVEGSAELRARHRADHLAHVTQLDEAGRIVFAGPLKDEAGERSMGAVIIFEARDLADARATVASDPFTQGGIFAELEIHPVLKAFPKT